MSDVAPLRRLSRRRSNVIGYFFRYRAQPSHLAFILSLPGEKKSCYFLRRETESIKRSGYNIYIYIIGFASPFSLPSSMCNVPLDSITSVLMLQGTRRARQPQYRRTRLGRKRLNGPVWGRRGFGEAGCFDLRN